MVYGLADGEQRHEDWPLRLGAAGTDAVVESQPVRCSHFDAFRFFTPSARPLNSLQPSRSEQVMLEQPGCLHATMDLYKWTFQLLPLVPSALVAQCFELARDAREVDMRASPYDLRQLGLEPIRIEEPEGRAAVRSDTERAIRPRAAAAHRDPGRLPVVDEPGSSGQGRIDCPSCRSTSAQPMRVRSDVACVQRGPRRVQP